jgi:hypothetical protein
MEPWYMPIRAEMKLCMARAFPVTTFYAAALLFQTPHIHSSVN